MIRMSAQFVRSSAGSRCLNNKKMFRKMKSDGTLLIVLIIGMTISLFLLGITFQLILFPFFEYLLLFLFLLSIVLANELLKRFVPILLLDADRKFKTNRDVIVLSVSVLIGLVLFSSLRWLAKFVSFNRPVIQVVAFMAMIFLLLDIVTFGWLFIANKFGTDYLAIKVNANFEKRKYKSYFGYIRRLPDIWNKKKDGSSL